MVDEAALLRFRELIRARAGLVLREQESPLLVQTLAARIRALQFKSAEAYLDFLAASNSAEQEAVQSEWKQLWLRFTNQESYFFRDAEQLKVIRDHALPEIMRRNDRKRSLRVWSAGCSTGEEPYSLAMILEEIPALRDWCVTIVGTDLSDAALERAKRGVYGEWSFRALDDAMRARFFTPHGNKNGKNWEIAPHLRRAVTFAPNNLLADEFPTHSSERPGEKSEGELHDIDLIVCRNVFIYFGREAVAQVLKKFAATLRPEGFLVCGHAELHNVPLGDFKARAFPQSVIYQRESASQIATAKAPLVPQATAPKNPRPALSEISARRRAAPLGSNRASFDASAAIKKSVPAKVVPEKEQTENLAALCLRAQSQANAGQLEAAEASCARALELAPFAALPYQLKARIAEERGDVEIAKSLLKKVIYLNPHSVSAALELGAIYQREGDAPRAAQMRRTALEILEDLGATRGESAPVPTEEHALETPLSIGELKRQLLADSNAAR